MSQPQRGWLDEFIDYTENTEPPLNFRRWVGVSTLASVLQRKCWLKWGSEIFYPNLYIVLVGPPATRKGTAMRFGKSLLDGLGIPVAADESSRQKLIKSMQESGIMSGGDGGSFHSSLTMHCTELTVFLGYHARELLAMLCKFYDCEDLFVYDTHMRGKEEVPNVWANLLGATTPGQLQASLPEDAVGSGFTSRVVFIYEPTKGKLVRKPTLREDLRDSLTRGLERVRATTGEFEVTEGFEEIYFDWYEKSDEKKLFNDPRLDYYVQRRPTHLFKLAMVVSTSRSDEMICRAEDCKDAINILEDAEKNMPRTFEGVGTNPLAGLQARVLSFMKESGKVPMSVLAQTFANEASFSQMGEIMAGLEQQKMVLIDPIEKMAVYKDALEKIQTKNTARKLLKDGEIDDDQ